MRLIGNAERGRIGEATICRWLIFSEGFETHEIGLESDGGIRCWNRNGLHDLGVHVLGFPKDGGETWAMLCMVLIRGPVVLAGLVRLGFSEVSRFCFCQN